MGDAEHFAAGKCLERLRDALGLSEFGFRIQGLAAHVVLRLGARVLQINSQGHPDIVAETERGFVRIEVEADIYAHRARVLSQGDLDGIAPRSTTDKGYFALAMCGPYPSWLLVDYPQLRRRHKTPALPAILRTLADAETSKHWTDEFKRLLVIRCHRLPVFSYDFLVRRALEGKPL